MSSNPRARLDGIFSDAAGGAGGNDALRYVAPREPSHKQSAAASTPPAAASTSTPASSVVYSTMVSLYQYDTTTRKYVQLGGATAGSKATVGCVIVGAETTYNLLFYNAGKQHLCAVPVRFGVFKPTLQAKSYVNFYDEQGTNWSVKFPSDAQVAEFMRQVFLAKIHVEIWGADKTLTKSAPNALIQDDLVFVKPDTSAVASGDTVAVSFSAWRVVGSATCAPADVVTKYAPFEKAGDGNGGDLRKIRLGDGSERIRALEEGIVGMKKGGKRMILAPPGKTNGQDWYLLEVQLLKTKTGGNSANTQRKSVPAVNTSTAQQSGDSAAPKKSSRRRSSPGGSASRSNSSRNVASNEDTIADLVPYEEDVNATTKAASQASKDEMELKELRLLQREKQLELQARALEHERMSAMGGTSGLGAMGFGSGGGFGSAFGSSSALFNSSSMGGGRPMDTMLSEINAKVDYLIRMAPGAGGNSSNMAATGPSDVSAVIRGVERLAGENDRLLTQINSQHQQYASYEKRCEELLQQNQRLQDEKRSLQERYQSAASSQLNATSELSALASARDAAVTQTNRLHAEYQQLLAAYYQLQQEKGSSSEAEEHKRALDYEREARARAEKQLAKETQTRALAEQELALTKKQHDVALQVKQSELGAATNELEKRLREAQTLLQKAEDERVKLQKQVEELAQRAAAESESSARDAAQQLEKVAQQATQIQQQNEELVAKLDASSTRVQELERELEAQSATVAASVAGEAEATGLAAEEKRIYVEQIELLQQQVKELEQEKFEQVQQDLNSGRLTPRGTSGSLPKGFEDDSERDAAIAEREQAAERALAAAESIKREAQDMLAVATHSAGNEAQEEREKLVALFKESVNEMFFRFQDFFEEETAVDGKQVLSVIRKVLKTSTKDILQRLQEPPAQEEAATVETTTGDAEAEESDGNVSDGPPAPPPQDASISEVAQSPVQVETTEDTREAAEKPAVVETTQAAAESEELEKPQPEVAKTASTEAAATGPAVQPALKMPQYPSSDESESESESDFGN